MDPSLPVLVARLPDRSSLARLIRAALRHEIARVPLAETPRPGTHTLDLRVAGEPAVSLLAELAGPPRQGQVPLRLRPLHRAQTRELYALLEAESRTAPAAPEGAPGSGPPDTEAQPPRTVGYEDSAPIARAMSGSAPPPARDDPRRTVRSAAWPPPPAPIEDAGPAAEDPSLSVSVVFEPDDVQAGVAAGARESFFDEDFANMPMPVVADGDEPVLTPRSPGSLVPTRPEDDGSAAGPASSDDDDTLIRVPGPRAPATSARSSPPPALEPPRKSGTGQGRRKRSTQSGKTSGAGAERKRKTTRHPPESTGPTSSATRGEPDDDPWIGRKIAEGKYSIESLIGSGAAGAVYKATHRELRRTVAIKVLHPHYQQDPQFMKSFRGEALAASQLDHPNVMRVLDFGQEPDGLVYIVMEHLSGRTLQNLLDEEQRLQTDRAVEIMIQVCAALSVAHDNGIIHRDIKPDNIMLVPSRDDEGGVFELVKVCDFGIAALQNPTREDAELGLADNVIAGTPEYMSPEQARGRKIDARSDVYACGICLYELVTGKTPFDADNPAAIIFKQFDEEPRPPSQLAPGLDSIVEEIILRAIQKDPGKRQQSARELRVELKEVIDPSDSGDDEVASERSIVENVPVLDDPASGFPGLFIALSSAVLRLGRFERGHHEAAQAMKDLLKSTKGALRGRRELTFARRDAPTAVAFCAMTGHGEVVDLRRLLGSQIYGSFGHPFIAVMLEKGIAAVTLREGIADAELTGLIEALLGPHANEELRKDLLGKPLRSVSVLFASDVLGRDRALAWKVGLCVARLARDLRALSNVRGISLKKMREIREDLVAGVAHLLTKGDEVRQLLFNADLVDDAVANLRGFSGFKVSPLVFERVLHEPCADAAALLLEDFDRAELDPDVIRGYLRAFAARLLGERSPKSDAVVAALHLRSVIADEDVPRDLLEMIRATALAAALAADPSHFVRTLDFIQDPDAYGRELGTLEAAMAVLARQAEARALLAVISVLARHAKGAGKADPRASLALRAMKSMIDKQRLLPIANAALTGPSHQFEPARQLLVLAGSAGAQALYRAREELSDAGARGRWVKTFRETGPAGLGLLGPALSSIEVNSETDLAFVEDLLRSVPDRQDQALGEAVAKFLAHPRLRGAALAALVPLWGERARKPLIDALEFAEEPTRIIAVTELRRLRAIDEQAVGVIEQLLTMKGSASDELRAASAAALTDAVPSQRARAVALLSRGVEGKRGFVAMLRGDAASDESIIVTEAMARALLALDRSEGVRAVKARIARSEGRVRARLSALLLA